MKKLITIVSIFSMFYLSAQQDTIPYLDTLHHSFLKEYNIPESNYDVDRFEHVVFTDVTPFSPGAFGSTGYDFIYNFAKKVRFIPGIGVSYSPRAFGLNFRTNLQFGSKLFRFELGNSVHLMRPFNNSGNYAYLSPNLGISGRHYRGFELGFHWAPVIGLGNNFAGSGSLINFKFQLRFYGIKRKRMHELGKWRGARPFNYKASAKYQRYKRKMKKKNRKTN